MKKLFNLAVIFAALTAAFTFASCSDEDDAEDNANEQALPSINVQKGKQYSFSNKEIGKSGYFKVVDATGTAGSKVVKIEITTKKDDAKGETYELGDDSEHTSYLMWTGSEFKNVKQSEAVENAGKVVFCLSSESSLYTITSATVNKGVKAAGATETLFGEK
jgi:hypothetical protein